MVCTSNDGIRIGKPATVRCPAGDGWPSKTRQTSELVPPMSNVMASGKPAATAAAAPANTPPAGPLNNSAAGRSAAAATGTNPPADVMTNTDSANGANRCRYDRHTGRK